MFLTGYKAVHVMMHVIIVSLLKCVDDTFFLLNSKVYLILLSSIGITHGKKEISKRQILCGVVILKMKKAYFIFIKTK